MSAKALRRCRITKRDVLMLRILLFGVATLDMVLDAMLKMFKCTVSKGALLQRLSILHRAGMIATDKVPNRGKPGAYAIYAVSSKARPDLTELNFNLDSVRWGVPKLVRHELWITRVLHALECERRAGFYDYAFADANILKQKRNKRSDPIPDLHLLMRMLNKSEIRIDLEVDLSSVLISKMVRRITKRLNTHTDHIIIILCIGDRRLENLRKACHSAGLYAKEIYFANLIEFCGNGFANSDLLTVAEKTVRLRL